MPQVVSHNFDMGLDSGDCPQAAAVSLNQHADLQVDVWMTQPEDTRRADLFTGPASLMLQIGHILQSRSQNLVCCPERCVEIVVLCPAWFTAVLTQHRHLAVTPGATRRSETLPVPCACCGSCRLAFLLTRSSR